MVEIGARGGGYRIFSDIIPLVSGVDIVQETVKIALGCRPDIKAKSAKAAVLRFFNPQVCGRVLAIEGVDRAKELPGVRDVVMDVKIGDRLAPVTRDGERPGYIVSFAESRELAVKCADAAEKQVCFVVESEETGPARADAPEVGVSRGKGRQACSDHQ